MFANSHVAFFQLSSQCLEMWSNQSFMFDVLFNKPLILYVYTCERYGGDGGSSCKQLYFLSQ